MTSAEGGYFFITKWGSFGTGDGQFKYPYDVAVDSSGDVFVADTWNNRIQKFGERSAPPHVTGINPDYGYRGETLDDAFFVHWPAISVSKTASTNGVCPGTDPLAVSIGDTVTYCFNVSNTGDVTLTSVTVIDDIYGPVTLGTTTLAPGETTEGTLTHIVTESDVPSVTNIATVNATDIDNNRVSDTDDCTINVEPSPCFIATAAYGTALHEDINVLREFRDEYLVTNPAGRVFVKIYYTTSPPVAALIRDNEGLSTPVREGFVKPLVYITRQFVKGEGQNG